MSVLKLRKADTTHVNFVSGPRDIVVGNPAVKGLERKRDI